MAAGDDSGVACCDGHASIVAATSSVRRTERFIGWSSRMAQGRLAGRYAKVFENATLTKRELERVKPLK